MSCRQCLTLVRCLSHILWPFPVLWPEHQHCHVHASSRLLMSSSTLSQLSSHHSAFKKKKKSQKISTNKKYEGTHRHLAEKILKEALTCQVDILGHWTGERPFSWEHSFPPSDPPHWSPAPPFRLCSPTLPEAPWDDKGPATASSHFNQCHYGSLMEIMPDLVALVLVCIEKIFTDNYFVSG